MARRFGAKQVMAASLAGLAVVVVAPRVLAADDTRGTVVRVVDGDTLVARVAGEEITIRLLNVDTPETKDPALPVQCMGPEATEFLTERLPEGTEIGLEYDVEREDAYGRTLAGVFEGGLLVNAEIAANGLGVPMLIDPNDKFYGEVAVAYDNAVRDEKGLFAPNIECTLAAEVKALEAQTAALPSELGADPQASVDAATSAVDDGTVLVAALADPQRLAAGGNGVLGLPGARTYLDRLRDRSTAALATANGHRDSLAGQKIVREREEEAARVTAPPPRVEEDVADQVPGTESQSSAPRSRTENKKSGSTEQSTPDGPPEKKVVKAEKTKKKEPREEKAPERQSEPPKKESRESQAPAPKEESSGGGGKSSCVPYGPEYPHAGGPAYSGKRYGMPGGKTYRRCS